jgi:hypothetical protein
MMEKATTGLVILQKMWVRSFESPLEVQPSEWKVRTSDAGIAKVNSIDMQNFVITWTDVQKKWPKDTQLKATRYAMIYTYLKEWQVKSRDLVERGKASVLANIHLQRDWLGRYKWSEADLNDLQNSLLEGPLISLVAPREVRSELQIARANITAQGRDEVRYAINGIKMGPKAPPLRPRQDLIGPAVPTSPSALTKAAWIQKRTNFAPQQGNWGSDARQYADQHAFRSRPAQDVAPDQIDQYLIDLAKLVHDNLITVAEYNARSLILRPEGVLQQKPPYQLPAAQPADQPSSASTARQRSMVICSSTSGSA